MSATARPPALIPRREVLLSERIALSVDNAATVADVSRSTIKKMIRNGLLHPSKVSGRTLIDPAELKRVLFGDQPPAEGV